MRSPRRRWALLVALVVVGVAALAPGPASAANVPATVTVLDSHGNGIAGVLITYGSNNGGWNTLAYTDANGVATGQVPEGNPGFQAAYNQGYAQSGPVGDNQSYTFHTVAVTLLNSNVIYAHNENSGYDAYTGPMQMFPGQYVMLTYWNHPVPFTVGNSGFTGGVLTLLDHTGNGLAGGTASDYLGGWSNLPGTTDANGSLVFSVPNDSSYLSMAMYYHGTRNQQNRSQLASSNFTFQTALANVKLKDADGNPLDTGSASYYAGAWQPAQNTSGGVTSFEMLPGAYSFAMSYNHTRQQLNGVAISRPTTDVGFQTGRVTAYFSQPFSWYNSQFYSFPSGQSMEFLPGQIGLQLPVNGCMTPKFAIAAGDHLVKTGLVATLTDNANHPLAGGIATPYYSGSWQAAFTNPTNSSGRTCEAANGNLTSASVAMVYNATRQQIDQNPLNGIFPFKTTAVTIELRDSGGNLIDTGSASVYASGQWWAIGDTSGGKTTLRMLPGSYSFAMTYLGTREQKDHQAVGGPTSTVTFQTGSVHSTSGTATFYYAGSWRPFTQDMELLSGTYSFDFSDATPNTQYTLAGGTTNTIH